jgi:preprotein translocase subunit YajC
MPTDFWGNTIFSIAPTALFGVLFWFVFRAMIRSDRSERKAHAKVEAEERARLGLPPRQSPVE